MHFLFDTTQVSKASVKGQFRYSQKSTVDVADNVSSVSNGSTQRSMSYRGSEISVFISPQPTVAVSLIICGIINR